MLAQARGCCCSVAEGTGVPAWFSARPHGGAWQGRAVGLAAWEARPRVAKGPAFSALSLSCSLLHFFLLSCFLPVFHLKIINTRQRWEKPGDGILNAPVKERWAGPVDVMTSCGERPSHARVVCLAAQAHGAFLRDGDDQTGSTKVSPCHTSVPCTRPSPHTQPQLYLLIKGRVGP